MDGSMDRLTDWSDIVSIYKPINFICILYFVSRRQQTTNGIRQYWSSTQLARKHYQSLTLLLSTQIIHVKSKSFSWNWAPSVLSINVVFWDIDDYQSGPYTRYSSALTAQRVWLLTGLQRNELMVKIWYQYTNYLFYPRKCVLFIYCRFEILRSWIKYIPYHIGFPRNPHFPFAYNLTSS